MTRRARRAASRVLAAGLVGLLALSGCGQALPAPAPEAVAAVPPPATTVAQAAHVLQDVGRVLQTADAGLDANLLGARLTGPALAIRTAEYVRAAATQGQRPPLALPTEQQVLVIPTTASWPRSTVVVTTQPEDLQSPRVLVLQQASPREQYHLWGWARLGPGVQMPRTADPSIGSAPVPPDADGLLATPVDAVTRFADLLTQGQQSQWATSFADTFFTPGILAARTQAQTSLASVATTQESVTADPASVTALATADGGALVIGRLTTVTSIDVTRGSISLSDPFEAALAGRTSVSDQLTRTWTDVVVLAVPPAGTVDGQIRVLAGEQVMTSVTGQ